MDITTIDNKIQEYVEKLNKKTLRKVKKGQPKRQVGIPIHLRKFYEEEISKLEKQKHFLQKQKRIKKKINWANVCFEDFHIRIFINNSFSEPYQFANSRKSLEFLKPYIIKRKLKPITVLMIGNKVDSIENLEELDNVINILSMQDEISNYLNDFTSSSFDKILLKIRNVTNKNLLDFFKIKDRSIYLNYLCTIQNDNYKIVPATEILSNNDFIITEEDTFLFTFTKKDTAFIIWESTSLNRATYIFNADKNNYQREIQIIFEFIISERNRKRSDLRLSINSNENPFKCITSINHNEFDSWKNKIENIIR